MAEAMLMFELVGSVRYGINAGFQIFRELETSTEEMAIHSAENIVNDIHNKYKDEVGYAMTAELKGVKPIWRTDASGRRTN